VPLLRNSRQLCDDRQRIRAGEESVMEPQPGDVFTVRRLRQEVGVVRAGMKRDPAASAEYRAEFRGATTKRASEREIFSDLRVPSAYLTLNSAVPPLPCSPSRSVALSSFPT